MKSSKRVREEAVTFSTNDSLVGVISDPAHAERGRTPPAFIFLNAGVTHHVGPNRLYVRLARALAAEGFLAMRFDFSGLGDSSVRTDDLPVEESVIVETREAMDLLRARRGTERFVLIGICSGATVSYMMAKEDARVIGAVIINANGHLHGTDPGTTAALRDRAMAKHSWRIAIRSSFRAKNFKKALGGQLSPLRVLKLMVGLPFRVFSRRGEEASSAPPMDSAGDLTALSARGTKLYHLYCEGDEGLDYFQVVLGDDFERVTQLEGSKFEILSGSNHMFTLRWSQDSLEQAVCEWARTLQ